MRLGKLFISRNKGETRFIDVRETYILFVQEENFNFINNKFFFFDTIINNKLIVKTSGIIQVSFKLL